MEASMNTPLSPEKSGTAPFENDLDYLMAEIEWIGARVRRIVAQRQPNEQDDRLVQRGLRRNIGGGAVRPDLLKCLIVEEKVFRQAIDSRLNLNRTIGPAIGLDRICQQHGLGGFERTLILLAFISCLGNRYREDILWQLDTIFHSCEVTVEAVALFLEMGPDETAKGLLHILRDSPLRRQGLVQLPYDPGYPADGLSIGISLSGTCVAEITGIPGFKGFCAPADEGEVP